MLEYCKVFDPGYNNFSNLTQYDNTIQSCNKQSNNELNYKKSLIKQPNYPPGLFNPMKYKSNASNANNANNANNSGNVSNVSKVSNVNNNNIVNNMVNNNVDWRYNPPPVGSRIGTETNWKSCLIEPVKDPDRYRQFIFAEFDDSMVIYDAFPKAKIHLLLIPKKRIDKPTDLSLAHLDLIIKLKEQSKQIVKWFKETFRINCVVGVHAIPSCKQLHIHIISDDFNSKFMKHKRQWNSFNTEYLIKLDHLIEQINISGNVSIDEKYYTSVINRNLQCPRCKYKHKNTSFAFLNELKRHYYHC